MVADIHTYQHDGMFDILLIHRTLLDDASRHACLGTLLNHLSPGGYLLLSDKKTNMPGLRHIMAESGHYWTIRTNKGGFYSPKPRLSRPHTQLT